MSTLSLFSVCLVIAQSLSAPINQQMHPQVESRTLDYPDQENFASFWRTNAQLHLKKHLAKRTNKNVAKNVILFLGDGMSIPTQTATRVYIGGESIQLSFEKFPHSALSKTYCVDRQVADSACSATAYLGGVKGNFYTIGLTAHVKINDCTGMTNDSHHVDSIAKWAQIKGKSTGLVTTARVTHASPAGVYGHTAHRRWETDTHITLSGNDPSVCPDLTTQLVTGDVGQKLNVIMGGGRKTFLPNQSTDEDGETGLRSDGINLIEKWKQMKKEQKAKYIWNRDQLLALDIKETDYVLGLFKNTHLPYHKERDVKVDPSLTEMTEAAIKLLSKNKQGFFLFVEGGRIDMAHHEAKSHHALADAAEFSNAIAKAVQMTNEEDTLIVVTADHAHTLSIAGYPPRGSNILGTADNAEDGLPYTTLGYINGPGYVVPNDECSRHNISGDDTTINDYRFNGGYSLASETHGGDDVVVMARGPWAHLYSGIMEQNVIPHIMAYAACLGDMNACKDKVRGREIVSSGSGLGFSLVLIIYLVVCIVISH